MIQIYVSTFKHGATLRPILQISVRWRHLVVDLYIKKSLSHSYIFMATTENINSVSKS